MHIANVLEGDEYLGCQTTGAKSDLELLFYIKLSQTLAIWDTMQIAKHLPRVPS